eukprot:gene9965-biopygen10783
MTWGRRPGVDPGSTRGRRQKDNMIERHRVNPGSIWCRSGVDLVSIWCRSGVDLVSIWCRSGADLVPIWCRSGADLGSRGPKGMWRRDFLYMYPKARHRSIHITVTSLEKRLAAPPNQLQFFSSGLPVFISGR